MRKIGALRPLTPLRQELANLPVEPFILIFRRFLKGEEKMKILQIPNFSSNLICRREKYVFRLLFRLFVSLCMMCVIFSRSNNGLKYGKRLNTNNLELFLLSSNFLNFPASIIIEKLND